MISPEVALEIINKNIFLPKIVSLPLENCVGYQLAEELTADRDFPPFNRAMMDGIAIQQTDQTTWEIEQTVFAGQPQVPLQKANAGIEIMTGAPVPVNCRAIIPIEDVHIEIKEGKKWATFKGVTIKDGQYIHQQGADCLKNETILAKNIQIRTIEIALAASIGKTHLQVYAKPSIALLSTGDELVGINQIPLSHQIRSSNIPMLLATLKSKGIDCQHFHIKDDKEQLYKEISAIIEKHDYLIISGGVSAGKKDFIPDILVQLGFTCHFHKIAQKPGKPMWFGTRSSDQKTIFALPGNPISTLVCFYNYFLPAVLKKQTIDGWVTVENIKAANPTLDMWLPARWTNHYQQAEILPHNGSGDMIGWKHAELLIWQKAGENSVHLPYVLLN